MKAKDKKNNTIFKVISESNKMETKNPKSKNKNKERKKYSDIFVVKVVDKNNNIIYNKNYEKSNKIIGNSSTINKNINYEIKYNEVEEEFSNKTNEQYNDEILKKDSIPENKDLTEEMPVNTLSYPNKEPNCIINTEKINQKDESIDNDDQEYDIYKNENIKTINYPFYSNDKKNNIVSFHI